jgi:hypothetical protein
MDGYVGCEPYSAVTWGSLPVANTIAETIEILYAINQENLNVDQQIALAQAYATFAQAERLELINQRLYTIHQILTALSHRVTPT